ncbi:hypothetical protein RIF29_41858 [Crotalaria pallida]|uniref:Uncharacterized protein n=1 Tax=Crotalaria pallida TaxID=3830 RepID=A0AAN9E690_CROPI
MPTASGSDTNRRNHSPLLILLGESLYTLKPPLHIASSASGAGGCEWGLCGRLAASGEEEGIRRGGDEWGV